MAKLFVVIPSVDEECSSEVLDRDFNLPRILRGVFVTAHTPQQALELASKSLSNLRSTFVVMEYKPEAMMSFTVPSPIFKEITSQGEVLPL